MPFNQICLIGVGLIGGSIALEARRLSLVSRIVAYADAKHVSNLETAKRLGVIDEYYTSIEKATRDSDFVVIGTPVGCITDIFQLLLPVWNINAIYTDVGSTKGNVVQALKQVFGYIPPNFIPGHPIAGGEKSGVTAAKHDLFRNRRVILTPTPESNKNASRIVREFWEALGTSVSEMDIEHHDTVLAATSHLPHILAFALVGMLGRKDEQQEIFKYAAGGFKDFSRIASSDPKMWQDISIANKDEIIPLIQQMQTELKNIETLLSQNNAEKLFHTFTYAKNARQRFLDQHED